MKWMIALILIIMVAGCAKQEITADVIRDIEKPAQATPIEEKPAEEEPAEEVVIEEVKEVSFDYIVSDCDDNMDASDLSDMGIRSIDWMGTDKVAITAYLPMNCEEDVKNADYEVLGNEFYLTFMLDHCLEGECAECRCAKKITFVIDGIEKQEFEYKLMGL